jgi:hypothetical protein
MKSGEVFNHVASEFGRLPIEKFRNAEAASPKQIIKKMRTIFKVLIASLVVFLASASIANESFAKDSKNPKLKMGTSIDLSSQDVVWHKDNSYVIAYNDRNYLVKTDDDGNAIVVDKVNNLADFIQSNGTVYVTRPISGIYSGPIYYPWYPSMVVRTPVYVHPRHYHPVIVRPHRVRI